MEKGGRTKRISEEYLGLKNMGHNVKVVTFSTPPRWVLKHYKDSEQWIVKEKSKSRFDLLLLIRLIKLVLQFRPAVIDAHCESSALYSGVVSKLTGTKCVATVHRSKLHYYNSSWKSRLYYKFLDGFIAVSNERKLRMHNQMGLPVEKIHVVHWGIDPAIVPADLGRESARIKLGIPDCRIILSLGHLGEIKGHEESIKAVAIAREHHPDIRLYIGGDGQESDYDRLHTLIEELNVQGAVTLLGQITNVVDWMLACDVFLQPSREEAFGLVFIEAGLCKRPTVATAVGGIPEIIDDGRTGFLVDVNSPEQIAEKLLVLLSDGRKANEIGEAAHLHVIDNFLLKDQVEKLAKYFQALYENGKAA